MCRRSTCVQTTRDDYIITTSPHRRLFRGVCHTFRGVIRVQTARADHTPPLLWYWMARGMTAAAVGCGEAIDTPYSDPLQADPGALRAPTRGRSVMRMVRTWARNDGCKRHLRIR